GRPAFSIGLLVPSDDGDASIAAELPVALVAVVRLIADEPLRPTFARDALADIVDEGDFRGGRTVDDKPDWMTMSIDGCHPLRALAPLGLPPAGSPFSPSRSCRR